MFPDECGLAVDAFNGHDHYMNSPDAFTNADLDSAIAVAHGRYTDRRPLSAQMHKAALAVMPGGNTRTVLHFRPYPFRVATAAGSRVTDVDGHTYVDLLGNYTAGLLGHSPKAVRDAIVERLDNGWSIGATHESEIELAQLIQARFPSMERMRFTNSGTEANLMAFGTAKHVTGRAKIVVFENGYHGGVLSFGHGGSPMNVPHEFVVLPFNDVAALELSFASVGRDTAAVAVELVQGSGGCVPATGEFVSALRRLCSEHGALLIFDEVMTSRLSPGGAQELWGVRPDMTTLGKYLGGGMSLGAFGGELSVMEAFDPDKGGVLTQAGTFNNNVISMAAGVAALKHVVTPAALIALNERGDQLRERLNDLFAARGQPFSVRGRGSMMNFAMGSDAWMELLFHSCLDSGFYIARRGMIALSLEVTLQQIEDFCAHIDRWAADPLPT